MVGAGHGDKAQIRMMIGVLLPKAEPQSRTPPTRWRSRSATRITATSVTMKVAAR